MNPSFLPRELEPYRRQRFLSTDDYPSGWKATELLESLALSTNCSSIVDIGGGANPILSANFVKTHGITYALIDISRQELDKAPAHYATKVCVDLTAPSDEFRAAIGSQTFGMAFSQMFLEHVQNPLQVHRNIRDILQPGGLALHVYPSPNNLPLTINRLMPESVSRLLLKMAHPSRDIDGRQGKFPAYYRMCGNSSLKLTRVFEGLGYEVLVHCGFIGHNYYNRVPAIDAIVRAMAKPLVMSGIGLTSFQLLVLRSA